MQHAALSKDPQSHLVYFYDLPKNVTSVTIAEMIKTKTGVVLDIQPQIKRELSRHFYTAIVKFNSAEEINKVKEELRYPVFPTDQKDANGVDKMAYCRALPFNPDFMGAGKQRMVERNVFVKKVPLNMTCSDLHKEFEKYGPITSVKISLNENHDSNGYGFVCFDSPQSVEVAIRATENAENCQAIKFQPKDKRDQQRTSNNLYVKNFPVNWNDEDLKKLFEPFGEISSCLIVPMKLGENQQELKFAFVCFADGAKPGAECANEAAAALHGKELEGMQLYVKSALSKKQRDIEKVKSMIRYKNSKKRCNLYVKNFPPTTTSEELKAYFSKHGEIESIRVFPKEGEAVYAFVCFKRPEEAQQAKNFCHSQNFNGKQLCINYYEIKEQRKIQYEEFHDKLGFQNYKKQSTNYNELMSRPDIYALLEQLITMIQPKLRGQQQRKPQMGGPGGPMRQHPGNMPKAGGFPPNRPPPGAMPMPGHPGMTPGMMPPQQMPPMNAPPMGMPPGMPGQMGQNPQMMQQQQQMMMQQQRPPSHPFLNRTMPLMPAVVPQNPNLKPMIGECIYEFVEQIVGEVQAPKITGMLIDLPIEEVRAYMMDPARFEEKVKEASILLTQQEGAAAAQRQAE